MRPSEALPLHRDTIRQLVVQAGMTNPRVFGSVLRGGDEDDSDLDLLVDPSPRTSLLDLAGLQIEIEARTGVKVDLLTPRSPSIEVPAKGLGRGSAGMRMHPERVQDYLEHILAALERIQRYASGKSATNFMADTLLQDGILRNLGIIGEAAHRLLADSPDYAVKHPEIPLAKVYGMRNRITHAYEEVDMEIVWNLVLFDVPDLMPKIAAALNEFKRGDRTGSRARN